MKKRGEMKKACFTFLQRTFLFLSRALNANSALVMMSVWKLEDVKNYKWRTLINHLSYLCNFAVIIFVKALEKEIWSLNNLEEVFFGQHPVLSSQLDHPSGLAWSHLRNTHLTFGREKGMLYLSYLYSMWLKYAKVIIEWNASLSIFVKL